MAVRANATTDSGEGESPGTALTASMPLHIIGSLLVCVLQISKRLSYLSRIERGKERPPRPEVIKDLAKVLAADPDVLFRLSSSTDPEVVDYLHQNPEAINLLRYIKEASFTEDEITSLIQAAESIKANSH